jgi:hypothetical protein
MTTTLTYYNTAKITAGKGFIVKGPGVNVKKTFSFVADFLDK